MKKITIFYIICAILLFITFLPFPYGYYQLLRIIIFIGAISIIYTEIQKKSNSIYIIFFGIIAIIFNPIISIHIGEKSIWLPIDIFSGILFLTYVFKKKLKSKSKKEKRKNTPNNYIRDYIQN